MAIQFRGRPNAKNRIRFGSQTHPRFRTARTYQRRCQVCSLPHEERLRIDLGLLSGYLSKRGYQEHIKHLADDIVDSPKFRDGSYGDLLYGRIERGMLELEAIAHEARAGGKLKIAILAWRNAGAMAETQAKLLGIGVPRAATKGSLHLHVEQVTQGELQKLIEDYQATALPAPEDADVVEVEPGEQRDD